MPLAIRVVDINLTYSSLALWKQLPTKQEAGARHPHVQYPVVLCAVFDRYVPETQSLYSIFKASPFTEEPKLELITSEFEKALDAIDALILSTTQQLQADTTAGLSIPNLVTQQVQQARMAEIQSLASQIANEKRTWRIGGVEYPFYDGPVARPGSLAATIKQQQVTTLSTFENTNSTALYQILLTSNFSMEDNALYVSDLSEFSKWTNPHMATTKFMASVVSFYCHNEDHKLLLPLAIRVVDINLTYSSLALWKQLPTKQEAGARHPHVQYPVVLCAVFDRYVPETQSLYSLFKASPFTEEPKLAGVSSDFDKFLQVIEALTTAAELNEK